MDRSFFSLSKAISQSLAKSKISLDLASAFTKFLEENLLLKQQAIYLLEEKKHSLQEVIKELYGISIAKQSNWSARVKKELENSQVVEKFVNYLQKSEKFDHQNSKYFQDCKQKQGTNKLSLNIGSYYCIIRIKPFKDKDIQQKFRWCFLQAKYKKKGWSEETPIKDLSQELIKNQYIAGEVIEDYLKNNPIIKKDNFPTNNHLPNVLVLDGEESHYLFCLLYGYSLLYFPDSQKTLLRHSKTLHWKLLYKKVEGYNLVYVSFYYADEQHCFDFHRSNAYLFGGIKQALVIEHNYWELENNLLSDAMMQEAVHGVLVALQEWKSFLQEWKKYYNISITKDESLENHFINFSVRELKEGFFWLKLRKTNKKPIFHPDAKIPKFYLSTDIKKYNSINIGLQVEDFEDYEWCLQNSQECSSTVKLFQYLPYILDSVKKEDCYYIHKVIISKILPLAKNYPYFYNHKKELLFKDTKNLQFGITLKKNPESDAKYFLKGRFYEKKLDGEKKPILFSTNNRPFNIIGFIPSYLIYKNKIFTIDNLVSGSFMRNYQTTIFADKGDIEDFYCNVYPLLKIQHLYFFDPDKLLNAFTIFYYKLYGKIEVREYKEIFIGRLTTIMQTELGEFSYPIYEKTKTFQKRIFNRDFSINRDKEQEKELYLKLKEHGWVSENILEDSKPIFSMKRSKIIKFLFQFLPEEIENPIIQYYIKKEFKKWKVQNFTPRITSRVKNLGKNQWFEVEVNTGKHNINIQKIIDLWEKKINYIDLGEEKGVVKIDKKWIKNYIPILKHLYENKKKQKTYNSKKFIVNKYHLGLLESSNTIKKNSPKLNNNILQLTPQKIPNTIKAKLRGYQKEGVSWFCFLRKYNFGGILADDMGLGKTLQAITFFEIIRIQNQSSIKKPHLVICPTSVVTNWQEEMQRFSPELKFVVYYGCKRKKLINQFQKVDLIITSYSLLQKDSDILQKIKYDVILLDEAQNIKNAKTKTSKEVCSLKSFQKISLTGTPIENNVFELWAQFSFLMPELLGSYKNFQNLYARTNKNKQQEYDFSLLRKQTKPFILRRIKQNVAQSLPPKTEQTLYCEMYPKQRKLYNAVLEMERKNILDKIDNKEPKQNIKICFFEALLKLRQICCDPRLHSMFIGKNITSAKLDFFLSRIEEVIAEGHRVLVFSQFVKMLNLMHQPFLNRNFRFLQLDGSTRKRHEIIQKFQNNSNYSIFLISLKAGGVGINLTEADYVIHYDPWWNIAVMNQASDRVYRIGQNKHVFVYKLITKNSVEEKILNIQKKKQSLSDDIISVFKNFNNMLKVESIEEFFS